MKAPVAVIIPSYNREKALAQALDSVLSQTLAPQEVCVVDDGSTDCTRELVRKQYPQVQYIYQENRGVSAARNTGVRHTAANWLAFLDSDDVWHADKLAEQLSLVNRESEASLIHCDEIWIRNGRRVNPMDKHRKKGGDIFTQSLALCAISPSAVILKRNLFQAAGEFDETLPACEDYDLWLRICSQQAVHYIDKPLLTKHGGHEDQLSRKYWGMDRFRIRALAKLIEADKLSSEQREQALSVLSEKCAVLINGARKRDNLELIGECDSILRKFGLGDDK